MATTLTLNRTGDKMPLVGFGCWKVSKSDAENTIYTAIKNGYRLIDGAADYGNEVEVGRGINKAISEGIVKREELFITTKLWNTFHKKEHVREAFDKQLKDLNLSYVDLYLIHFPIPLKYVPHDTAYPPEWFQPGENKVTLDRAPLHECWPELEKLVEDGVARNIGVSNFNVQLLMDLLTYAKIKPAVLQIELHPYLQQNVLVKWVQEQGIQITAYSSFGPASFVPLGVNHALSAAPLLEHDVIVSIAKANNKTPAQVLLRWSVEKGIAVIPKSSSEARMVSNHDITSWSLSKEDMAKIAELDIGLRFNNPMEYGFNLPIFN